MPSLSKKTLRSVKVDLNSPPGNRWNDLAKFVPEAQRMTDGYVSDLGGTTLFAPFVGESKHLVPSEYDAEIRSVSNTIKRPYLESLLANLYYDAFQMMMGCTAFAVATENGPLHARNLDWWTQRNDLSDYTMLTEFHGGPTPFQTVGWPGFIGAFSGVAKNRFSITMNAVLSDEPRQAAISIAMLIRKVFETATSFDEAVKMLQERPIASDCLMLVTGLTNEQMVVIERTCTKSALRHPTNGRIAVTNDYRLLKNADTSAPSDLHDTSCYRFDRAMHLAEHNTPKDLESCLRILKDKRVKMDITVQHMAMSARTGELLVELP